MHKWSMEHKNEVRERTCARPKYAWNVRHLTEILQQKINQSDNKTTVYKKNNYPDLLKYEDLLKELMATAYITRFYFLHIMSQGKK